MPSAPLRLLVLEDQVILRKLIARQTGFFSRHPTQVDEFSDPAEALRSVAETSYDLIITDIGMPGMSGIDFIKNLSAIGCRASLLIISGYDSRTLHTIADMARAQGMGSVHFLTKPYNIDQFLHKLNKVFTDFERQDSSDHPSPDALWQTVMAGNLELVLEPVCSLDRQQLHALHVAAMRLPDGQLPLDHAFYQQLAVNPQLPMLVMEVVMERLAYILAGLDTALRRDVLFTLYLDSHCLADENLFDRYVTTLRQSALPPGQIGFLLADGLHEKSPPVCFENIAKLKYFGFSLLAAQLGEGSLTVGNLLKLPLDGARLSLSSLPLFQHGGIRGLLQCCGLSSQDVTLTDIHDENEEPLPEELAGCRVCGEQIALPIGEAELAGYLQQRQHSAEIMN